MLNNVGRYRELPSWRKHFKRAWKKAAKTPITLPLNEKYCPDPLKWVCTCPQFHKHRFLLCKHLVQSVHPVDPKFFLEVKRGRTTPFWSHSSLIPLDGTLQISPTIAPSTTPNENDSDSESDDDSDGPVDTGENISSRATFQEHFTQHINVLREFCDGLEFQVQFGDNRMLNIVEREGASFFRLAHNCLDRERRQRSTRTPAPATWEQSTSNAMFYRARPSPRSG
jgi:hypothetical protein